MNKDFWNNRYTEKEFAYGTEPNEFFKEQIEKLKSGRALFLGEGEGRNAVYAAKLGWQVDAVDFSSSARDKALKLAEENNVKINYEVCDLNDYKYKENHYDLVVMIFVHLPIEVRKILFRNAVRSLNQNGKMIIEVFSKEQIKNSSGGPQSIELLYSENDILSLVKDLRIETMESKVIELDEGEYHKGKADVIRFVGVKK
ncbi:MAG: class I SAM-dependent methyltransferase [Ignavibacteria bacterium]|nr:class I SAM-dependent methyltransferase [Ignavibacteria bacterium]